MSSDAAAARRAAAWRRVPVPLLVFLLALLPRLHGLGSRPFWYDEVVSLQRAALPLPALLHDSFLRHHLPAYFLLIKPFTTAADPQFWLRLPSAVCGALSVMLAYRIAARAAGSGAGVAAALILGLAPTQIAFSQEARSYALMICLILVALDGLVGLVLAEAGAARRWRDAQAPRADWIRFIAGSAGALCVLGDAWPWLLAANLAAAVMIVQSRNRAGLLRNFLAANAITLAVSLPFYIAMLALQDNSVVAGLSWVPEPTAQLVWYDIASIYLMRVADFTSFHLMATGTPLAVAWIIGVGLAAACLVAILRLRTRPDLLATLLLAVLFLPLSFSLVSIWRPLLMPRYILWSAAPFAILAGIGIDAALARLGRAARAGAFAAAAALLLVNLLPFYRTETKARWDLAAALLVAESRPSDVYYLSQAGGAPTMRYYLPKSLQLVLIADWSGDLAHALAARARGHRVWAIYGDAWQTTFWESRAAFQARLAPLGPPAARQQVGERITLWRYDPPARAKPP